MTELKVGQLAPEFTLTDDRGLPFRLKDYLGKKVVVLYFYPKDFTSGCIKEACSFRDDYKVYEEKGAIVIGVSLDSEKSHKKFSEKHNLPFSLLSDNQKEVAKKYGVLGFGGRVAKRVTFIIDKKSVPFSFVLTFQWIKQNGEVFPWINAPKKLNNEI